MSPVQQSSKDGSIPTNIREDAAVRATLTLGYGCPTDPNACTRVVGSITTSARASLGAGAAALASHLTVTLSSTVAIVGVITVTVTSANGNILVPTNAWHVTDLSPGANKILNIPFTFVPLTGQGLLTITTAYGNVSGSMPQMQINIRA